MKRYTNVEKEQKFQPIISDYERFVKEQEAKRVKRIPERGAQIPPQKPEVEKMRERMQKSLGSEKQVKPAKMVSQKPKEVSAPKIKEKPKYIAGYEKAGKPSRIRVGGSRPEYSQEQLESRKKMLRMQKGRR